ncbi:MAG: hypothetical protein GDA54_01710 [Alphaproteobacteria bacterium GM7ARS4]|nr:hypothetical protein [Alphaproteobacteria bacterium GM7ARS4]
MPRIAPATAQQIPYNNMMAPHILSKMTKGEKLFLTTDGQLVRQHKRTPSFLGRLFGRSVRVSYLPLTTDINKKGKAKPVNKEDVLDGHHSRILMKDFFYRCIRDTIEKTQQQKKATMPAVTAQHIDKWHNMMNVVTTTIDASSRDPSLAIDDKTYRRLAVYVRTGIQYPKRILPHPLEQQRAERERARRRRAARHSTHRNAMPALFTSIINFAKRR